MLHTKIGVPARSSFYFTSFPLGGAAYLGVANIAVTASGYLEVCESWKLHRQEGSVEISPSFLSLPVFESTSRENPVLFEAPRDSMRNNAVDKSDCKDHWEFVHGIGQRRKGAVPPSPRLPSINTSVNSLAIHTRKL